jgi:hypothetical protein
MDWEETQFLRAPLIDLGTHPQGMSLVVKFRHPRRLNVSQYQRWLARQEISRAFPELLWGTNDNLSRIGSVERCRRNP